MLESVSHSLNPTPSNPQDTAGNREGALLGACPEVAPPQSWRGLWKGCVLLGELGRRVQGPSKPGSWAQSRVSLPLPHDPGTHKVHFVATNRKRLRLFIKIAYSAHGLKVRGPGPGGRLAEQGRATVSLASVPVSFPRPRSPPELTAAPIRAT